MDTEIVIQSEVSQKEKNGCCKSVHKYMGNLKKWYRWSYLQTKNRDMENKCMDTKAGWDELKDWDWHTYIIDTTYKIHY